jgi:hypothetical protein
MKNIIKLTKAEMINLIIGAAKSACTLENRFFNGGDLFFTLAFKSDLELKKICKKLNLTT